MKGLAKLHVWWPKISADIEDVVRKCEACQRHAKNPARVILHHWEWPTAAFDRIHIDFAGPYMKHMFLVIVDAYSKWLEVIPMEKIFYIKATHLTNEANVGREKSLTGARRQVQTRLCSLIPDDSNDTAGEYSDRDEERTTSRIDVDVAVILVGSETMFCSWRRLRVSATNRRYQVGRVYQCMRTCRR